MATVDSQIDMNSTESSNLPVHVESSAPFTWIKQGIKDFGQIPVLSLLYGILFTAVCIGLYYATRATPWLTLAYFTGLVIVGPFLAAGLYTAARDIEQGIKPSISNSLKLMYQRKTYLTLFALMLSLVMAAWIRFTALFFAITSSGLTQSEGYLGLLFGAGGWTSFIFFMGSGLVLVTAVFVISAVSIPYIIDKDVNFIEAIITSYRSVTANPGAMFVWAIAITVLTAIGIATAFIGLAIVFPILGYATWHSYRALVKHA